MISAVVLTKNEENNIIDCLESIAWCDEVVVIDDFSQDRTRELAERKNAKILQRNLGGNFAQQRNFGLENAKGPWVLFVDADERVPESLQKEIQWKTNNNSSVLGFRIRRVDSIFGKILNYGETGNVLFVRLGKKGAGKWYGTVHEEWKIKEKVEVLESPLLHYPHQSIAEFLKDINFYTTIRAKELYSLGTRSSWFTILLYPKGKFLFDYFIKLGFLDGIPGLIMAAMMSFHSFLVRAKLWLLQEK